MKKFRKVLGIPYSSFVRDMKSVASEQAILV